MSEYTQRYQGHSHQELYDAVMAGKPEQIEGVAAQWASLKGILDGLGRELSGDLDKLGNTWTGSAGREFQRRLGLIVVHSDALGEGMAGVKQGLTMMAGQLRTAHKQAENPEETDDNDQMINGALSGSAFGLPGAVIGGMLGHQQDKEEQQKAHQRMVTLVAELAAGYDLSAYDRVVDPPPPPPDTPETTTNDRTTPRGGPHTAPPTAAPTISGHTTHTGDATIGTPDRAGEPPVVGVGDDSVPDQDTGATPGVLIVSDDTVGGGTSLAGADPLVGGALLAGGAAGLAGLSGPATMPASAGGPGLLFGAQGGAPAGGVLRTSSLASSGSTPTTSARPASAPAPADNRSGSGIGRSMDGRRAEAGNARPGSVRAATRPGLLGGRGHSDDDESDERLTWLTEDEMVWREGESGPPPVLGTDR
ncbi:WXG100 family type VII secretion target [Micromonospora sp. WMMD710]|uniref:WXG100 family type VII secretion target n=1 Tax=Micromonospora sp. WMMD710 TaxID=3016085 RepID=UPI002417C31D|nr:WXG100 family type VII secretion target [Micromonospora sp. WMMD710]MDG4760624.1 WXG100 family type VII secretion target [Micromonospora sp. WMMD710]